MEIKVKETERAGSLTTPLLGPIIRGSGCPMARRRRMLDLDATQPLMIPMPRLQIALLWISGVDV